MEKLHMQTNKIKCKYQHLIDITYSVDGCWTPLLVLSVMVLEVMVRQMIVCGSKRAK
jgi:hypothetical protein